MSKLLSQRFTPFFAARIRQNHRLLSSSSSALKEAASSDSPSHSFDAIEMTDNCIKIFIGVRNLLQRMKELQASETSNNKAMLRLGVETGGCSGFQYVFDLALDDKINLDDRFFCPLN